MRGCHGPRQRRDFDKRLRPGEDPQVRQGRRRRPGGHPHQQEALLQGDGRIRKRPPGSTGRTQKEGDGRHRDRPV